MALHCEPCAAQVKPRIEVADPVTVATKLRKHTVYTVRVSFTQCVDDSGEYEVLRRYRHFLSLRLYMRQKWPGVIVPGLPPKKLLVSTTQGKMKPSLVNTRRKQLENFCLAVVEIPYLYESEEFQTFCKGSRSYEEARLEFPVPSLPEIRVSYEILFADVEPDLARRSLRAEDLPHFAEKLAATHTHCSALRRELKAMKQFVRSFHSHASKLSAHFLAFHTEVYMEYAKEHQRRALESSHWPQRDTFTPLIDWVKSEEIAIEYMMDALRSRESLRKRLSGLTVSLDASQTHYSSLQSGRKSLSDRLISLRTKGSQQLEALRGEIEKDLGAIAALADCWLLNHEVPHFRACRSQVLVRYCQEFWANAESALRGSVATLAGYISEC